MSDMAPMTGGAVLYGYRGNQLARCRKAIDLNVMLFLGMFIVGQALVASGYLYYLAYHLFNREISTAIGYGYFVRRGFQFNCCGVKWLMNDTLAI
jgi:hypothetical protein